MIALAADSIAFSGEGLLEDMEDNWVLRLWDGPFWLVAEEVEDDGLESTAKAAKRGLEYQGGVGRLFAATMSAVPRLRTICGGRDSVERLS